MCSLTMRVPLPASSSEVDAGRRNYSDFLILTRRKRNRIGPDADALEALNIPVEVSGAGAFGESAEVAALTVLLRSLAYSSDSLSLVAVLRGPFFGISDPELFAFKQAGGWFSIFHDRDTPGPGSMSFNTRRVDRSSTGPPLDTQSSPRPPPSIGSSSTPAT